MFFKPARRAGTAASPCRRGCIVKRLCLGLSIASQQFSASEKKKNSALPQKGTSKIYDSFFGVIYLLSNSEKSKTITKLQNRIIINFVNVDF